MPTLALDNPYSLEIIDHVEISDDAQIGVVLDRARAVSRSVRSASLDERKAVIQRVLEHLQKPENAQRIAREVTEQMGKPLKQAQGELRGFTDRALAMVALAERGLADPELPSKDGFRRRIRRVPLGVVLCLPAWNYPLVTAVNAVVPALLAGNAVVIKHAPRTPWCGRQLAEAFDAVGAKDWVQALFTDYPTTERMAADPRVDYVAFTGSVHGGRRIYQSVAASRFIDVGLELGGNDAAYVAEDADLERAADGVVDGACYNAGQSCCAVERVFVHASRYDELVQRCRALLEAYRLGDPESDDTNMGPIAQAAGIETLTRHVEDAREGGADIVLGGRATQVDGKGRFFEPSLILGAKPDSLVLREESFGPLLPIVSVDDEETAIRAINDSPLGLTASIWTSDEARAARVAEQLAVGTVFMNQCDVLDPYLPWTGFKDSGKGATLSELGFHYVTRPQGWNFKR